MATDRRTVHDSDSVRSTTSPFVSPYVDFAILFTLVLLVAVGGVAVLVP